ncbi:SDR family oxidoreductase [Nesterenkonia sp.]|uniref:SDR family oxidoreductase n=1 Tax=Nesterenkonia sp. TaxID=704201 RepID=UPI00263996F2|nr:SDR family oxidoreductase [Nesterenkonia sp.]
MAEQRTEKSPGTVLISGGSRGIGRAVAVELASRGADVALLAKTDTPHPKLEGTVHTAVEAVEEAGGRGLAVVGDVRSDDDVARAVEQTVEAFGGIDVVIHNASAIDLSPAAGLDMKRYDLMQDINVRGTFLLGKTAMPHLIASAEAGRRAQMLSFSPPVAGTDGRLNPEWLGKHVGYTLSKYGMTMATLGLGMEMAEAGVQVNTLWPATLIDTAAIRALPGGQKMAQAARSPQIMADAVAALVTGTVSVETCTSLTDEQVLAAAGVEDLSGYAVTPGVEPLADIFL